MSSILQGNVAIDPSGRALRKLVARLLGAGGWPVCKVASNRCLAGHGGLWLALVLVAASAGAWAQVGASSPIAKHAGSDLNARPDGLPGGTGPERIMQERSGALGPVQDVIVTRAGHGVEPHCSAFKPTPDDVRDFFAHAVIITGRQEHDYFDWMTCTAEGTLTNRYGHWHWVLRLGGTATVSGDSDSFRLADPRQESPLCADDCDTD